MHYDGRFGAVIRTRDPNGFDTTMTYDSFGRPRSESPPGGPYTEIYRAWCSPAPATCPDGGVAKTLTAPGGAPPAAVVVDLLGRGITSAQLGADGRGILASVEYDNKGLVDRETRPYFAGETKYWTTFDFDAVGRLTLEVAPGEGGASLNTQILHSAGPAGQSLYQTEVRTTNPLNQVSKQRFNVRGELVETRDALDTPTAYTYDTFGNLLTTTVNNNTATRITNTFDIRGRRRSRTIRT
jgi:YD repeat-containing protein